MSVMTRAGRGLMKVLHINVTANCAFEPVAVWSKPGWSACARLLFPRSASMHGGDQAPIKSRLPPAAPPGRPPEFLRGRQGHLQLLPPEAGASSAVSESPAWANCASSSVLERAQSASTGAAQLMLLPAGQCAHAVSISTSIQQQHSAGSYRARCSASAQAEAQPHGAP